MRLESLTGLRFWAAVLVFAFHADQMLGLPVWMAPVELGHVGVSFFFVLSGFVLAWSHKPSASARRFYWRRFARVWPLHALVTTLVLLTGTHYAVDHRPLIDYALLFEWIPNPNGAMIANPPSWSLSVEAYFYLAFPLVVLATTRTRRPVAWAFASVAAMALAGPLGVTHPTVLIGQFAAGVLLAVAMQRGWKPPAGRRVALPAVALVYLGVWLTEPHPAVATFLLVSAFGGLIAASAAADLNGRTARRSLVLLGNWSFALYLVHYPVLVAAQRIGERGLPITLAALAVAVWLSAVLYGCFERPVERWLRGLGRRPALAPAAS